MGGKREGGEDREKERELEGKERRGREKRKSYESRGQNGVYIRLARRSTAWAGLNPTSPWGNSLYYTRLYTVE